MNLGPMEIYDGDTILYRGCFATEKRKYVAACADGSSMAFENKKDYNSWAKANPMPHEMWEDHQVEPVENAIHIVKQIIDGCHSAIGGLEQRFLLSGKNNFRYKIATIKPYKGNRDPAHKPVHLQEVREWAIKYLGAEVIDGKEADDGVGILATNAARGVCIISNDKDLSQLPGRHFNFVTKEAFDVTKRQAGLYFFQQLISGDATDNIPGIEGIGYAGAIKILAGCSGVREAETRVLQEYRRRYGVPEGDRRFLETGRLVKIHTSSEEINNLWYPKYVEISA